MRKLSWCLGMTIVLGGMSACNQALLDLGENAGIEQNGPSLTSEDAGALSRAGCTEWIDDDIHLASEGECDGTCSPDAKLDPAGSVDFPTMKSFIDQTGGAWRRCGTGQFGPSDTIGVEFAPGCRLYFLNYDEAGKLTRGTEIRHQGVFGIYDPAKSRSVRSIVLTTTTGRTTYDVALQRCPKALVLTPTPTVPGRAAERVVLRPARETDGGFVGTFPR